MIFWTLKFSGEILNENLPFFVKPTIPSEVECARRVCKSCWTCSLPTDDDTDDVFVPTIQRTNRAQRCSFIKPLFFIYTQLSSFIRLKVLLISHLAWMAYNRHGFFFLKGECTQLKILSFVLITFLEQSNFAVFAVKKTFPAPKTGAPSNIHVKLFLSISSVPLECESHANSEKLAQIKQFVYLSNNPGLLLGRCFCREKVIDSVGFIPFRLG